MKWDSAFHDDGSWSNVIIFYFLLGGLMMFSQLHIAVTVFVKHCNHEAGHISILRNKILLQL